MTMTVTELEKALRGLRLSGMTATCRRVRCRSIPAR